MDLFTTGSTFPEPCLIFSQDLVDGWLDPINDYPVQDFKGQRKQCDTSVVGALRKVTRLGNNGDNSFLPFRGDDTLRPCALIDGPEFFRKLKVLCNV